MLKSFFLKIHASRILNIIAIVTAVVLMMGVFTFISNGKASAASNPVSINLIYYGTNSNTTDRKIIDANPEYLVNNSPAGPWRGNADISKFVAAGIKYFDYIDGGYEGTVHMAIPNDLQSNLNYIDAIAAAGAYGVFVDEVSSHPSARALDYLMQLAERAHSLGLKVVFNAGVDSWSDSLMKYCDFINSSEVWNNAPLTASQTKWANRTWFLTQGVNDATTAAQLTNAAWTKGINAAYVCNSYMALPAWLPNYVELIGSGSEPEETTPTREPEQIVAPTPEPEQIVTPKPEPEQIVTPNPEPEVVVTTTPEPDQIVAPETTTTTPTTPETATTATTTNTVTATTPVITTTVTTITEATATTTPIEGNSTGNFFSKLWQSIQSIWGHITDWLGI
jgi:hypothetical protein